MPEALHIGTVLHSSAVTYSVKRIASKCTKWGIVFTGNFPVDISSLECTKSRVKLCLSNLVMRFVNISLSCSFFTILDILLFLHTLDFLEICSGDLESRQAQRFSSGLFFNGQLSRSVPEYLCSLIIGMHNLIPTSIGFPKFLFF